MKHIFEEIEGGWLWKRGENFIDERKATAPVYPASMKHYHTIEQALAGLIKFHKLDIVMIAQLVELRDEPQPERIQEDRDTPPSPS